MKKFLAIASLLFATQAHAGVFVEPFLGFESTDVTQTSVGSSTKFTSTNNGFDYGARLGYYFGQTYWAAVEYTAGSGKNKGSSTDYNYSKSAVGAVFGYDAGKYNFWLGYGFSDKWTITNNVDFVFTGTNFKVGVGYDAAKNVSTNLELIIPTYTKYTAGSSPEVDVSSVYSTMSFTTLMLSVSFPFGGGSK